MVQELLTRDLNMRRDFCTQLLEMMDILPQFLPNLITLDEAHFHLSGYVNKQIFRHWAEDNPRLLHQTLLHSQKVTVWCGLSSFGILAPYILKTRKDMQLR
jgi:hypothetical protein